MLSVPVIAAGGVHTCGLDSTGLVACWGANNFGQLGIGLQAPNQLAPTLVTDAVEYQSVAAGADRTCAILLDGNVDGVDYKINNSDDVDDLAEMKIWPPTVR